jgi:hypothetical protein
MSLRTTATVLVAGSLLVVLLVGPARANEVHPRDDLAPMGCFLAGGLQAPGVVSHVASANTLHRQLDLFSGDPTRESLARAAIGAHVTEAAFFGTQSGLWLVRGGLLLGRTPLRRSTLMLSAGMLDTAMGAGGVVVGAVLLASKNSMGIEGIPGDLLRTSGTVHLMFGLGSVVAGLVELIAGAVMRDNEHWDSSRTAFVISPSPGGLTATYRW